jgi:hypothetical protein
VEIDSCIMWRKEGAERGWRMCMICSNIAGEISIGKINKHRIASFAPSFFKAGSIRRFGAREDTAGAFDVEQAKELFDAERFLTRALSDFIFHFKD